MLKRTVTSIFVPPFSKQMPSIHLPSPPPKSTHCEQFNDIPTRGPHPKGFNDSVNKAHPWLQMCVDFSPPLHHKAQKAAFKPSFHNSFSLKKVLNTSYAHFGKCPQVEGSKHISRSPTTPRQSGSRLEAILPSQKKDSLHRHLLELVVSSRLHPHHRTLHLAVFTEHYSRSIIQLLFLLLLGLSFRACVMMRCCSDSRPFLAIPLLLGT